MQKCNVDVFSYFIYQVIYFYRYLSRNAIRFQTDKVFDGLTNLKEL